MSVDQISHSGRTFTLVDSGESVLVYAEPGFIPVGVATNIGERNALCQGFINGWKSGRRDGDLSARRFALHSLAGCDFEVVRRGEESAADEAHRRAFAAGKAEGGNP